MTSTGRQGILKARIAPALAGAWDVVLWILLLALSVSIMARYGNAVLSHNVTEMLCVIFPCGIFMLTWNARKIVDNQYFVFLGVGFLFFGAVDLLHLVMFNGIRTQNDIEIHTRLWFTARLLYCAAFLGAPFFVDRRADTPAVFGGFFAATAALLLAAFTMDIPAFSDTEAGVTAFKKFGSLVVSGSLIIAVAFHWRVRDRFDTEILACLVLSIFLSMAAEVAADLYAEAIVYNGLAGHYLKTLSFYLAYRSVAEKGLRRPYDLLFRNLERAEEEVRSSRDRMESVVKERTSEIRGISERLSRELEARQAAESEREATIGLLRLLVEAKNLREMTSGIASFLRDRLGCSWVSIRCRPGGGRPGTADRGMPGDADAQMALCADGAGDCLCGSVLSGRLDGNLAGATSGGSFWTNSVSDLRDGNAQMRRLSQYGRCFRGGIESLALIPLRAGGETIGLLQVCDLRKNRFAAEDIGRCERYAEHIAAGLSGILSKDASRESAGRFGALARTPPPAT